MIKKKQDAHFTPFVTFPWKSTPFLSTFPITPVKNNPVSHICTSTVIRGQIQ